MQKSAGRKPALFLFRCDGITGKVRISGERPFQEPGKEGFCEGRSPRIQQTGRGIAGQIRRAGLSLALCPHPAAGRERRTCFRRCFSGWSANDPGWKARYTEKAWFCRVTINCANSYWRNPFRRRTQPLEETGEPDGPPPEEKTELDACLDKLSRFAGGGHLYYYEGYSPPEIAGLLGRRNPPCGCASCGPGGSCGTIWKKEGNSCV